MLKLDIQLNVDMEWKYMQRPGYEEKFSVFDIIRRLIQYKHMA